MISVDLHYFWSIVNQPFPKVRDIIHSMLGIAFATASDVNDGCYHIKRNPDAQNLFILVFKLKLLLIFFHWSFDFLKRGDMIR
jgi:hypothetical protein